MNAMLRTSVLSLSVVLLGACASMQKDDSGAYMPAASPSKATIQDDDAYIAYVERNARRRGITLVWVNKPTKHVDQAEQQ